MMPFLISFFLSFWKPILGKNIATINIGGIENKNVQPGLEVCKPWLRVRWVKISTTFRGSQNGCAACYVIPRTQQINSCMPVKLIVNIANTEGTQSDSQQYHCRAGT